jgi:hypothetical protein
MELVLPVLALGGLYKVAQQQKNKSAGTENFDSSNTNNRRIRNELLPNMDVPNRNFPEEYPVLHPEADLTSQLSTLNVFDAPSVYTDKYFNANMVASQMASDMATGDAAANYRSLTGEVVGADYFRHNNMVPFFGSKSHANNAPNATESTLDNYVGSGSQFITKTEQAPLFAPDTNYQWAYGMPNTADFVQSRMNPSMNMANVRPFEPVQVGPGLGLGYTSEGSGGFNSGLMARDQWREKNVDELRVASKQKASGLGMLGYEGPAISRVTRSVETKDIGQWEQRGPDRAFDMGPDRYFTTMGIATAPTARGVPVPKHVSRPDTSVEYTGVAGNGQTAHVIRGEYMPSHHQQLESFPLGAAVSRAGAPTDADFGVQAAKAYPNNRSVPRQPADPGYFGAVKNGLGAAVAPFVDMLRPSRKENTVGNLRPYQNPKTAVEASYVYNPHDRAPVTIRQTTENSKFHVQVNANQHGGAYQSTPHQATANERDTTTDFYYSGGAAAPGEGARTYDAEYRQRNNDIKSSTIQGHTLHGGMSLLNGQVHMTQRPQEAMLRNDRPVDGMRSYAPPPSVDSMGAVQGHANLDLYQGQQLDRNNGDVLSQLKGNPYTLNVLNYL